MFFCARNFCRPPEIPLWSEISVSEKNFKGKKSREILHSRMFRSQMVQKIRTWISEDFLGPKVTTPKFGGRQKFLRVWAYFWKFELWVKNFSKISYLQKGQKLSFFNICYFFLSFWAKWPKLPIFAQFCLPEISTSLGGTPWKLRFWLQMRLLQPK